MPSIGHAISHVSPRFYLIIRAAARLLSASRGGFFPRLIAHPRVHNRARAIGDFAITCYGHISVTKRQGEPAAAAAAAARGTHIARVCTHGSVHRLTLGRSRVDRTGARVNEKWPMG